jgi:hypothetical protein
VARRHYVIDRRRQFRTAFIVAGLAAFLLIFVNVAFGILRMSQAMVLKASAPQLGPVLQEQDTRTAALLAVISVLFVIGVFVLTIAETHRTAGAIFAVRRHLDRVRDGDYRVTLKLRPRDTLRDLEAPFDDMVRSLRDGALGDADRLDGLADDAADNPDLAAALRTFAEEKRAIAS